MSGGRGTSIGVARGLALIIGGLTVLFGTAYLIALHV